MKYSKQFEAFLTAWLEAEGRWLAFAAGARADSLPLDSFQRRDAVRLARRVWRRLPASIRAGIVSRIDTVDRLTAIGIPGHVHLINLAFDISPAQLGIIMF